MGLAIGSQRRDGDEKKPIVNGISSVVHAGFIAPGQDGEENNMAIATTAP
jgi:hypothetical protein